MISTNSGFNEAPPTKKPSTFALSLKSLAFLPLTEPPYKILVFSACSAPMVLAK